MMEQKDFTLTTSGTVIPDEMEELIRQIVREEIAAHEEQLKVQLTLDGEKIAEALGEHLRKRREATGETWLDDIP